MGLLSTEIEIHLGSKNVKRYEELGYKIPRIYNTKYGRWVLIKGTIIKVKISDLSPNSKDLVSIRCDKCGKEYKIRYDTYASCNHEGKYYCKDCANTVFLKKERDYDKIQELKKYKSRKSVEYMDFINAVLERDNYKCRICGCNKKKNVHHLDGYNWCVEKRIDINNGITLCEKCHADFHSLYGRGNNTKEQFYEWLKYPLEKPEEYIKKINSRFKVYCFETGIVYSSVNEISFKLNLNPKMVYKCCKHKIKTHKHFHLIWLFEYEKMNKMDIKNYLNKINCNDRFRKVICLNTGEIFNTIREANKRYNVAEGKITDNCRNRRKSAGHLFDGTKLQWKYYDE